MGRLNVTLDTLASFNGSVLARDTMAEVSVNRTVALRRGLCWVLPKTRCWCLVVGRWTLVKGADIVGEMENAVVESRFTRNSCAVPRTLRTLAEPQLMQQGRTVFTEYDRVTLRQRVRSSSASRSVSLNKELDTFACWYKTSARVHGPADRPPEHESGTVAVLDAGPGEQHR
jgi:hypothetical protein